MSCSRGATTVALLFALQTLLVQGASTAGAVVAVDTPSSSQEHDAAQPDHLHANGLPSEDGPSAHLKPFVPTDEWQTVEEGQAIPAGLHVQMNLDTGRKEAKKLDEPIGIKTISEKRKEKLDQLKPFLEDLSDENETAAAEGGAREFSEEEKQAVFDTLFTREDVQHMKILLKAIDEAESGGEEVILEALDELEYLVHQIDNANDLEAIGGLDAMMDLLANGTEPVRSAAAAVVGACSQNNMRGQTNALKRHALTHLIGFLRETDSPRYRKRVLFAIAALVRRHGPARQALLEAFFFKDIATAAFYTGAPSNLQVQAITLVAEMLTEEGLVEFEKEQQVTFPEDTASPDGVLVLAGSVASSASGLQAVDQGVCGWAMELLAKDMLDEQEKALNAMLVCADLCRDVFAAPSTITRLQSLATEWEEEEDFDMLEMTSQLAHTASLLVDHVSR